jgi:hypothetical protein
MHLDIREPSQPVLAAHIHTAGTAKWVAVENNLVVFQTAKRAWLCINGWNKQREVAGS